MYRTVFIDGCIQYHRHTYNHNPLVSSSCTSKIALVFVFASIFVEPLVLIMVIYNLQSTTHYRSYILYSALQCYCFEITTETIQKFFVTSCIYSSIRWDGRISVALGKFWKTISPQTWTEKLWHTTRNTRFRIR